MELGRAYCRALGLGVCGVAIAVAAFAPLGGSDESPLITVGDVRSGAHDGPEPDTTAGGSLSATVFWPQDVGELDPTDICVVVYDADGGVVRSDADVVSAVPGQPVAARWEVGGLADGSYTLYVAQCPSPSVDEPQWVEPQYYGGGAEPEAAGWVDVAAGAQVDLGPIVLHRAGLETWPQRS